MKLNKHNTIIIVIVLLILGLIVYSIFHDSTSSSSCINVPNSERAACCEKENKDSITVSCVGNWGWDNDLNECSYFCDLGEEPEVKFCTQDVMECADGSFVGRDPKNNCEFKPCPSV